MVSFIRGTTLTTHTGSFTTRTEQEAARILLGCQGCGRTVTYGITPRDRYRSGVEDCCSCCGDHSSRRFARLRRGSGQGTDGGRRCRLVDLERCSLRPYIHGGLADEGCHRSFTHRRGFIRPGGSCDWLRREACGPPGCAFREWRGLLFPQRNLRERFSCMNDAAKKLALIRYVVSGGPTLGVSDSATVVGVTRSDVSRVVITRADGGEQELTLNESRGFAYEAVGAASLPVALTAVATTER